MITEIPARVAFWFWHRSFELSLARLIGGFLLENNYLSTDCIIKIMINEWQCLYHCLQLWKEGPRSRIYNRYSLGGLSLRSCA